MVALPACVQDSDIPLDYAMTSADKLAQQLNNSLANLITVPAPAGRDKVNAGFVQLALAYTAPTRTTMFASIESSFNGSENNGRCRCNWG